MLEQDFDSTVALGALIADDEPPPFRLFNAGASSPLLLTCDHASARIPRALGTLGLSPELLDQHVAWDIGAASVAQRLATLIDAELILTEYSRLVIDVNRVPGHEQSIAALSEDIRVPDNADLSRAQAQLRADTFFWPYHRAIDKLLDASIAAGRQPILVSIHSFTPVFHSTERPWHAGILWDSDEPLARSVIEHLAGQGLCVGDNQPYDGRDMVGYTTRVHAGDRQFGNVLVEIRQDLISDEAGAASWAERLASALADIVPDCHLARRHHD